VLAAGEVSFDGYRLNRVCGYGRWHHPCCCRVGRWWTAWPDRVASSINSFLLIMRLILGTRLGSGTAMHPEFPIHGTVWWLAGGVEVRVSGDLLMGHRQTWRHTNASAAGSPLGWTVPAADGLADAQKSHGVPGRRSAIPTTESAAVVSAFLESSRAL
jgi:hypothetical protein